METTIFNHRGKRYLLSCLDFKQAWGIKKEAFNDLIKGYENTGFNPNPYPSENWFILPASMEQRAREIKAIEAGVLKMDVFPEGTFFGNQPREYDKIIVRLHKEYKW